MDDEYVTFTEAREIIGVASKDTLRRIVERERWDVVVNPQDARERLLRRDVVERYAAGERPADYWRERFDRIIAAVLQEDDETRDRILGNAQPPED